MSASAHHTRRNVIAGLAVAPVAVAIPAALMAPRTTRERLDAAIEELKAATQAHIPNTTKWIVRVQDKSNEDRATLVIVALTGNA